MAKKKTTDHGSPRLFEQQERAIDRRLRRQRAIFIPKYVREAAGDPSLASPSQIAAHQIAIRWADRESSGQLSKDRETTIDTQFLDQLFREGLGYADKTTSPKDWQLEHKYSVKEVGIADGALGEFPSAKGPTVVVELKDAHTDLDRDKVNGRTAVQQCWDYLNALPNCPWGIVSNFSTIRLYHRTKGALAYEEFTLQELRDRNRFHEFYCLFERAGLLPSKLSQTPRAMALLEKTEKRQKQVGDDLYRDYQWRRLELIEHLHIEEGKDLNTAIRIAQKLLDRIIFIAFCEDRELLPPNSLEDTKNDIRRYSRAKNPAWENFLDLFKAIDQGAKGKREITAFNGGLFAEDPEINALELESEKWTNSFAGFGTYDFSEEVNVEVLGHLFERSITELEKLRVGGLFALRGAVEQANGHANGKTSAKPGKGKPKQAAPTDGESPLSKMPKSAQRKRFGIYYTPPAFTGLIVERTVDALIRDRFAALAKQHKVDPDARKNQDSNKLAAYWAACLESLKSLTICDPACGSGAFLIRAYDELDDQYKAVVHGSAGAGMPTADADALMEGIPDLILSKNLYGVDLSLEAVEITQLALWIRSARKGKTLADLSTHIVHGNSLVSDKSVDPHALDWARKFPTIFALGTPALRAGSALGTPALRAGSALGTPALRAGSGSTPPSSESRGTQTGGFDCVIGNPPWERVKVQEREFFSLTDPATAQAVSAADRRTRIAALPTSNPDLHTAYLAALDKAQKTLDYARLPATKGGRYPLTGKGDVNLYMLFAELARTIVAPDGMVGLLVPSGIATDDTTKEFFNDLMDRKALVSLFDFENKEGHFEDVHRAFKFTALVFGGGNKKTEQADFVFFAHNTEEVAEHNKQRHIILTAADMKLLNPNTRTCPIFRSRRDAALTRAVYKRVPILIDESRKKGGNPWEIKFVRMFDQTNDAEHFHESKVWEKKGYKLTGNIYVKGTSRALPLYEAKMAQAFDHRAASVIVEGDNWVRQGQKAETSLVQHANPEYAAQPRWWVAESEVERTVRDLPKNGPWYMGFKDITSPTNERTMIASFVPLSAATNKFVLLLTHVPPRRQCCLLGNFNSFVFDYVTRQKIGSITLNFFIVEQLPTLPPDTYAEKCPWSKKETLEHWISERVLKLSCTAEDMIPLATACAFKGSRGDGVHIWKEPDRARLRAELDAAFFHLYQIEREDAEYMLSTFTNTGFIHPDKRAKDGAPWAKDSIGEEILNAYDALGSLS